jgi:hypothetical protein
MMGKGVSWGEVTNPSVFDVLQRLATALADRHDVIRLEASALVTTRRPGRRMIDSIDGLVGSPHAVRRDDSRRRTSVRARSWRAADYAPPPTTGDCELPEIQR